MSMVHRDYLYQFLIEQNLQRFATGGRYQRDQPLWFYLPVLLLGCLPWTFLFPALFRIVLRSRQAATEEQRVRLFWGCSLLVSLAIFSVSSSKIAYYVLPLLPPLALLLADGLASVVAPALLHKDQRRQRSIVLLWIAAGLLMTAAAGHGASLFLEAETLREWLHGAQDADDAWKDRERLEAAQTPFITAAIGLLGLTCLLVAALWRRARPLQGVALAGAVLLVMFAALPWALSTAEGVFSVKVLAKTVEAHSRPNEPILIYGRYVRGVPFYLQRKVVLWEARHAEFGHLVKREEAQGLALQGDEEALRAFLRSGESVLVITNKDYRLENLRLCAPTEPVVLQRFSRFIIARIESGQGSSG
jgi:hypothetical protein